MQKDKSYQIRTRTGKRFCDVMIKDNEIYLVTKGRKELVAIPLNEFADDVRKAQQSVEKQVI